MRISAIFDSVDAADRAADRVAAATYVAHRTVTHPGAPAAGASTDAARPMPPLEGGTVGGIFGSDLPTVPQPLTFPGPVFPESCPGGTTDAVRLELEVSDGAARRAQALLTNAHGREIRLRHGKQERLPLG